MMVIAIFHPVNNIWHEAKIVFTTSGSLQKTALGVGLKFKQNWITSERKKPCRFLIHIHTLMEAITVIFDIGFFAPKVRLKFIPATPYHRNGLNNWLFTLFSMLEKHDGNPTGVIPNDNTSPKSGCRNGGVGASQKQNGVKLKVHQNSLIPSEKMVQFQTCVSLLST